MLRQIFLLTVFIRLTTALNIHDQLLELWAESTNNDLYYDEVIPYLSEYGNREEFQKRSDRLIKEQVLLPPDLMVRCGKWHLDLFKGNDDCCTSERPCYQNEGDCDGDEDCFGNLICLQDHNCPWVSDEDDCCGYPPAHLYLRGSLTRDIF